MVPIWVQVQGVFSLAVDKGIVTGLDVNIRTVNCKVGGGTSHYYSYEFAAAKSAGKKANDSNKWRRFHVSICFPLL